MGIYNTLRDQKRLPFLYLYILPVCAGIILLYPERRQLTGLNLWYLFPAWVILGHILCGLSYAITGCSLKKGIFLFINSFTVYGENSSSIHLQVAFLTSLLEETIFRYFLLFYLNNLLNSSSAAIFLTSVIFTAYHFHLGWNPKNFLRFLDLFIFSSIISTANIITWSFYPAFIIHGMHNYILRCLLVTKNEYEEQKIKKAG